MCMHPFRALIARSRLIVRAPTYAQPSYLTHLIAFSARSAQAQDGGADGEDGAGGSDDDAAGGDDAGYMGGGLMGGFSAPGFGTMPSGSYLSGLSWPPSLYDQAGGRGGGAGMFDEEVRCPSQW